MKKNEFNRQYFKKSWINYSNKAIELAGNVCEICGLSSHHVVLQVHHPYYISNLMPWEYDIKFCEVLCKGCHFKAHKGIQPSKKWLLIYSDWEFGSPSGDTKCDYCGSNMMWWNIMVHPEQGEINVGYDCAEKLGDNSALILRKNHLKERAFIHSPRWKKTPMGMKYKHGDRDVFILEKHGKFILNISGVWGKLKYFTLDDAKKMAFKQMAI